MNYPPHSMEAERSVLGSGLMDNQAIESAKEIIAADDFYSKFHRIIFEVILSLSYQNEPVNLVNLISFLKEHDRLEKAGGEMYLNELAANIPPLGSVAHAAKIVREKSILRELAGSASEIINRTNDMTIDVDSLLDQAEEAIFNISRLNRRHAFFKMESLVENSLLTIEIRGTTNRCFNRVLTGFEKIDELTSGLQNGELIIIAGSPGTAKTAFSLNIAKYAAMEQGIPVAVFSLDTTREQLVMRLLAAEAKLNSSLIHNGTIGETDWHKLLATSRRLSEAPIFIDDTQFMPVLDMKAKARRLAADRGVGLIIVDYLQLIGANSAKESEGQEMSKISSSLRSLARELNIPVIALFQLSQKLDYRKTSESRMADFRELSGIEQNTDVIAFVQHAECNKQSEGEIEKEAVEIIIAKQKSGPFGTVSLGFIEEYSSFESLECFDK